MQFPETHKKSRNALLVFADRTFDKLGVKTGPSMCQENRRSMALGGPKSGFKQQVVKFASSREESTDPLPSVPSGVRCAPRP
jgi:hypothetical protein